MIVFDKVYRNLVNTMKRLGLYVGSPPLLQGRYQFMTAKANHLRCMIKVRWMVKAVNTRIRQLEFLSNTVKNSSFTHLEVYLSIACSIINLYQPAVRMSTPEDVK